MNGIVIDNRVYNLLRNEAKGCLFFVLCSLEEIFMKMVILKDTGTLLELFDELTVLVELGGSNRIGSRLIKVFH